MEHIYAVKNQEELIKYQRLAEQIQPRLSKYINFLKDEYAVCNLPRSIIWTSADVATRLISNIPIPAYTNAFRIVMNPDVASWREIYLRQLYGLEQNQQYDELYRYYTNDISINHILQILGHELAHHTPLFLNGFGESGGIWFEEGMAEFISRQYFLTDEEYEAEYRHNLTLVELLKNKYGAHSLEDFGAATYEGDYASIFFEYWRSYLTVRQIVENHHGSVQAVFESYHCWAATKNHTTLLDWFGVKNSK